MSKQFSIQDVVNETHTIATEHGFWEPDLISDIEVPPNIPEKLALIHSEVSGVLEELRKPEINYDAVGEELIDVVIRAFDLLGYLKLDADKYLNAKIEKNRNRPYKHNKRF